MRELRISGELLARNTLFNFIGQAIPLLVGVITIPFIIRGLGMERFGVLSLAWVIVGYFSLFDLGLRWALTKFVAELLGKGETERLPVLFSTSLALHLVLGTVGGLFLAGVTPLLVERVLNMPPGLIGEVKTTFFILAGSVPVVIITGSLSGVLAAGQRFDLVNAVSIPSMSLSFLIPVGALLFGLTLPGIVSLLLVSKLGAAFAYLLLCRKAFPVLKRWVPLNAKVIYPLLSFGGWVTVTNIVGPILTYLDRFLLGSLVSVAAVGYYAAPYEVVTRLWIIPASLVGTLFPAFSALWPRQREEVARLYARGVKYLLLTLSPVVLLLVVFANHILRFWLGEEFAQQSTLVLQILAIAILVNSLGHMPINLLHALGRPDLPAKFHLVELVLFIGMAWLLITKVGIAGAALAWTFRVALDTLLLFIASCKILPGALTALAENRVIQTNLALLGLVGAFTLAATTLGDALLIRGLVFGGLLLLFLLVTWNYLLDGADRKAVSSMVCQVTRAVRWTK